jgi:hypothetical protein
MPTVWCDSNMAEQPMVSSIFPLPISIFVCQQRRKGYCQFCSAFFNLVQVDSSFHSISIKYFPTFIHCHICTQWLWHWYALVWNMISNFFHYLGTFFIYPVTSSNATYPTMKEASFSTSSLRLYISVSFSRKPFS